jgi:DNA-binding CsgD family transcriptional regulator
MSLSAKPPLWLHAHTEMSALVLTHGWVATSLGALDAWPQSLRTPVQLLLQSKQPMCLAWGPELLSVYNDGFKAFLGATPADALGKPFRQLWSPVLHEFEPIVREVLTGVSHCVENKPVSVQGRNASGLCWFTFSWTPLYDEEGKIQGFFCIATETTALVLEAQKQAMLAGQSVGLLQQIRQLMDGVGPSPQAEQSAMINDRLGEQLTKRQRQLLELIAKGWTTTKIADALNISTGTAFTHRRELMRKLNVHNTAEITRFAIRHGLAAGDVHPHRSSSRSN